MDKNSSLNENVFDVTVDAFRRDREKGQGGDFCIIALNSVHAIVAYDFKTHSIHEIENVCVDADVLKIVNKGGTSTFFPFLFFLIRVLPTQTHIHTHYIVYSGKSVTFHHSSSKKRIDSLVHSIDRSRYITRWKESRRLFCKVKLETQNEMESTVKDTDKDKNSPFL